MGHAVAQLGETLRYRPRVRFPIVSLEFFIDITLPAVLWPWDRFILYEKWVSEIYPRGKGDRCLGLTTLPSLCAYCLEIWEPQTPGILRVFPACAEISLPCIFMISVVTCPYNKTGWRKIQNYLKLKSNKLMYANIFTSASVLVDCTLRGNLFLVLIWGYIQFRGSFIRSTFVSVKILNVPLNLWR
jgi:hypothetical protein